MTKPPFAPLSFAPAAVDVRQLPGGGMILSSPQLLGPYPLSLGAMLVHWAATQPERVFLAERKPDGVWRKVTFAQTLDAARRLGQALLDRGLGPDRPLAILSENAIDHGLISLGAMHVGIPVAPISVAYSLMSKDYAKLRSVLAQVKPGVIYASNGQRYAPALKAAGLGDAEFVVSADPPADRPCTLFTSLLATQPTRRVDEAYARVGPDTIAKLLFTSGSTGDPKGVINTQRMMGSNQKAMAQVWTFLGERPPVLVDWLPWNHTFGGNHNFNMMLYHGGTLYIDEGKPMPGLIERSAANLKEIAPTLYFNVPRGYDMLIPFLEKDDALAANFFRHLDIIFYAAAALPQSLWERLEDLSIKHRGQRVRMISSWGATETAPAITSVHYEIDRAGVIGIPLPGVALKMLPNNGKMELRVKGPNVTPGYWKRDDLTQAAFDEEGYYKIGDAGRLDDPDRPAKGIIFDGRIAEDFKLSTGTWVHAGALRVAVIAAAAPAIQDAVIAGHDRDEVGMLVFPNPAGLRELCPDLPADAPLAAFFARPEVKRRLREGMGLLAGKGEGSSTRITRAMLMEEPPNIDAGEITDKGYLNQRAVLTRRAALVDRLYASPDDPDLVRLL
ncbi:MAG: feruloyl-CoA synthase [Rhodospirillales bacterium]|nr:feruloyl-CoA synthase [Rhodospirillales bacterium]